MYELQGSMYLFRVHFLFPNLSKQDLLSSMFHRNALNSIVRLMEGNSNGEEKEKRVFDQNLIEFIIEAITKLEQKPSSDSSTQDVQAM